MIKKLLQLSGLVIIAFLLFGLYYIYPFAEGVVNDAKTRKIDNFQEIVVSALDDTKEEVENIEEEVFEDEDCIFDLKTQTDDFLKNKPNLSNYTWSNKTKTATIILDEHTMLKAFRGGCDHFNFYGTLYLKNTNIIYKDQNLIFEKGLWIVNQIMSPSDVDLFTKLIAFKKFKSEENHQKIYYTFDQDVYCTMTLVVEQLDEGLSIQIGYTIC